MLLKSLLLAVDHTFSLSASDFNLSAIGRLAVYVLLLFRNIAAFLSLIILRELVHSPSEIGSPTWSAQSFAAECIIRNLTMDRLLIKIRLIVLSELQ